MKIRKEALLDLLVIAFGSAIYALSFVIFLSPNNIAPGGVTGISLVIHRLIPYLSIGTLIVVINIPLFIAGWRYEGRPFLFKSLLGTAFSSAFIDLLSDVYTYTEDPLLASLYGGLLMGLGLGIIFTRGATTGGSDIVSRLLKKKFPHYSMGRIVLVVDLVVISLAAIAFGHISYVLYGIISLYVSSLAIDKVLYGFEMDKVAFIITQKPREVFAAIDRELERGGTYLHSEGAHSGKSSTVLLCAIKMRQIAQLKHIIRMEDENSFVIITDAREILGDGFRSHTETSF